MKIEISRNIINNEGENEITFKFIKEESDNYDFHMRMWRLNSEKILDMICWMMFNLSKGKEISARAWSDEELKALSEQADYYKKKQIKDQKLLTGMMMLIGLVFVASPIFDSNPNSLLNLWMVSAGYIIIIGSAIAYGLIGWDAKKREEKELKERIDYQNQQAEEE